MDKLVAFFKNVWFRRSVAVLCWGYTALMVWIAYLNFGFYFEFENPTPLFVLYLFVNISALGLMILSRNQVITQINAYVLPPIIFTIVIFGFGNWYMIAPPLAVTVAVFFINKSNETLKTVLGTMFLLMYVIGVVGYVGINMFMPDFSFTGVDLSLRDKSYEKLSDSGEYRVVRYLDESGDRKVERFYVEYTGDDVDIPFGKCKKLFGCKHVTTATFTTAPTDLVEWKTEKIDGVKTEVLYVEGVMRVNPYLIVEAETDEADSDSDLSDSLTSDTSDTAQTAQTDENTSETAHAAE